MRGLNKANGTARGNDPLPKGNLNALRQDEGHVAHRTVGPLSDETIQYILEKNPHYKCQQVTDGSFCIVPTPGMPPNVPHFADPNSSYLILHPNTEGVITVHITKLPDEEDSLPVGEQNISYPKLSVRGPLEFKGAVILGVNRPENRTTGAAITTKAADSVLIVPFSMENLAKHLSKHEDTLRREIAIHFIQYGTSRAAMKTISLGTAHTTTSTHRAPDLSGKEISTWNNKFANVETVLTTEPLTEPLTDPKIIRIPAAGSVTIIRGTKEITMQSGRTAHNSITGAIDTPAYVLLDIGDRITNSNIASIPYDTNQGTNYPLSLIHANYLFGGESLTSSLDSQEVQNNLTIKINGKIHIQPGSGIALEPGSKLILTPKKGSEIIVKDPIVLERCFFAKTPRDLQEIFKTFKCIRVEGAYKLIPFTSSSPNIQEEMWGVVNYRMNTTLITEGDSRKVVNSPPQTSPTRR